MKKKIIAIMLTLTMCVGLSACGSTSDGNSENDRDETVTERRENTSDESGDQTESDIQVADAQEEPEEEENIAEEERTPDGYINDEGYYVFGWYEQDGHENNGPEPIEWEILDENENGTLLISRYVLGYHRYNSEYTIVTWETCSLRNWLNDDFYNTAFDDNMKAKINTVTLVNEDNPYSGTPGGNDTNDKIFCLSLSELLRYYPFDYWDPDGWHGFSQALITPPTEYVYRHGMGFTGTITNENYERTLSGFNYSTDCVGKGCAIWWLRTPSCEGRSEACVVGCYGNAGAGFVAPSGTIPNYGIDEDKDVSWINGVRPALYISR